MSVDLDKLKVQSEKLLRLLQAPQPGLSSWNRLLVRRLGFIANVYKESDDPGEAWVLGNRVSFYHKIDIHCATSRQAVELAKALNAKDEDS